MQAIIFDLDGTLVDSAPDIHSSVAKLLEANGRQPIVLETIRTFIGNGVPKLVERVMRHSNIEYSKEAHARLTEELIKFYMDDPTSKTTLYPGVVDVLVALKERGFILGVCTNKIHKISLQVLEGLGIEGFFSSVIGGDSLPTSKPDPAMLLASIKELGAKKIVYVGDSEIDAETAVAANVPFVIYTKGYLKTPLSEVPHKAQFDDYANLPEILRSLI